MGSLPSRLTIDGVVYVRESGIAAPVRLHPAGTMDFEHVLEAAKSSNGGWSYEQLQRLGVLFADGKPVKGWRKARRKMSVPVEIAKQVIALKDKHLGFDRRSARKATEES